MYKILSFPLKIIYQRLNPENPGGRGSYALEIQMGGGVKEVRKPRWEGGQKMLPSVKEGWIFLNNLFVIEQ